MTLGMLSRRTDIARHVRRLVIRPHARKQNLTFIENIEVASAIRNIASGMCLDALVRFHWDADELPLLDEMWFALRMGYVAEQYITNVVHPDIVRSCPQLRYVGISVGATIPHPRSHVRPLNFHHFSCNLSSLVIRFQRSFGIQFEPEARLFRKSNRHVRGWSAFSIPFNP